MWIWKKSEVSWKQFTYIALWRQINLSNNTIDIHNCLVVNSVISNKFLIIYVPEMMILHVSVCIIQKL